MPVDKFGRHISKYYFDRLQETLDLSYEIILAFKGFGATSSFSNDPSAVECAYNLEHGAITYKFPLKTAIIDRVPQFYPYDITIHVNGEAINPLNLEGRELKQNDSLMFVTSKKSKTGKMFMEVVLKCPVHNE